MLFLAALTSAFSILEVIVSFAIDTFDVDRRPATVAIAAVIFLVGVPTAMSLDYLTLYDAIANQILLIGGGLLLAIFGGWFFASEASDEPEGMPGGETLTTVWIWVLRVPVVLVLAYVLYNGIVAVAGIVGDVSRRGPLRNSPDTSRCRVFFSRRNSSGKRPSKMRDGAAPTGRRRSRRSR